MKKIDSWEEISHSKYDCEITIPKSKIAIQQLETSIIFFLGKNELESSITLAGASGEILHQLVKFKNKTPTLEKTRLICQYIVGYIPKKQKYKKHFSDLLGINYLKHKSLSSHELIKIDLIKGAETAITAATLDYLTLYGNNNPIINAFMNYLWLEKDGIKLMEEYKSIPLEIKNVLKRI